MKPLQTNSEFTEKREEKTMRSEFLSTRKRPKLSVGNVPTRMTQCESHMVVSTMESLKDVVSGALAH